MSSIKNIMLKVCGMREADNILDVAALHPHYMGFIFYPKSPRYVSQEFIIPKNIPNDIKRVGVFVNASTDEMMTQVARLKLNYLQLHGTESVAQCEALKRNGVGIIKVFSVSNDFDFNQTTPYKMVVDYFLFDTKGKYFGGNAQTFDWTILKKYDQEIPFFLSGGLSSENIHEIDALHEMNIHALDLNSGVESSPGVKDISKLNAFYKILNSNF